MSDGMATDNKATEEKRIGWRSLDSSVYVKITLIALLLWWFFRQEIDSVVYRWLHDASWSHGFLIPLFSLYFLTQHSRDIVTLKPKVSYFGLLLLIGCFIFYTLDIVYFRVAYFQPLTLIAAIGAIVLFLGGWRLVRYTWLPIIYLIFAIKLPDRFYTGLTIPMRTFAAKIASSLLSIFRVVDATADGVVINVIYNGKQMAPPLDVAEACSGMRLLMAFLALGVAMAYLHYRPVWQRLVLLASTIPIAILCNVVRVTVTGFIYVLGDPKYAQGIYHDLLGMGMLPLAFGLYGALAWFMSNLFVNEAQMQKNVVVRRRN